MPETLRCFYVASTLPPHRLYTASTSPPHCHATREILCLADTNTRTRPPPCTQSSLPFAAPFLLQTNALLYFHCDVMSCANLHAPPIHVPRLHETPLQVPRSLRNASSARANCRICVALLLTFLCALLTDRLDTQRSLGLLMAVHEGDGEHEGEGNGIKRFVPHSDLTQRLQN